VKQRQRQHVAYLLAFMRFSSEATTKLKHIEIYGSAQHCRAKHMGAYISNCYIWSVHQENTTIASSETGCLANIVFPCSTFSQYAKHDAKLEI
jgi:hypothetical protein